jgi:two-component system sensor kinase FixL
MSWTTVIWSMVAASTVTMALPHLVIGLRHRNPVNLYFSLAGLSVAVVAAAEYAIMHGATLEQSGRALRIAHVPVALLIVALVGFGHHYFGTGRLWLGVVAAGLRILCLIPNFLLQPNLTFAEMTGLRHYAFLGETLAVPIGRASPWLLLAYLSSLLLLIYFIEASVKLWRRSESEDARRRAIVVGGGIVFFLVVAQTASAFVNAGLAALPFPVSIAFMAIVIAMGFELTYDIVRSARLARELQASEERVALAAESARLALWEWNVAGDEIWMTAEGRDLLGLPRGARLDFNALVARIHPDDRAMRAAAIRRAVQAGGSYEMEYRLLRDDGAVQWMSARGRCERDEKGVVVRMLGVSLDITRQKQADAKEQQHRDEVNRLSRMGLLGEMATSLAHELNQPLTAIVTNASAAERFLARGPMNVTDIRSILADIGADGRRAGDVIRGIKGMARKVEGRREAVNLNTIIADVLRLVRTDALEHNCTLASELEPSLPTVRGDPVQLQQVLLNLVINAFDVMRRHPGEPARVEIVSRRIAEGVEVAVRDYGPGLPAEEPSRVFERFYSTKPDGMGMGLSIARTIIEAHGGILDGATVPASEGNGHSAPGRCGARFWFRLPISAAAPIPAP